MSAMHNPLLKQGADPWLLCSDGCFIIYYTASDGTPEFGTPAGAGDVTVI